MEGHTTEHLKQRIRELEHRLEESEYLIEAIKAGEVDAFAVQNGNQPEIYTLQSGDYAYRILVEEFGEGAINVTEDGLIVYTNQYFLNLLGLPYDQVMGTSIFDFIKGTSREKFSKLFREAKSGQRKGEVNLRVGGKVIPVYLSMTSLQPNLPTIGMIITDFSEKKKNEQLILRYQKTLEHKNHELTQSNAELASFVYIASHDLQEPLRKIQTFESRLVETEMENLTPKGKEYLNRMRHSAIRMQNLIEDLLTYSRTTAEDHRFTDTDLNKVVQEVCVELREEIENKDAILEVDELCHAHIIPFQFRQLFQNLISNSLKFARAGHPPHIKISSDFLQKLEFGDLQKQRDQKFCHIKYSDNGIGFKEAYKDRIFELFQRLHSKSDYEGTGVGLAIVKKIVENHKGLIIASSKPHEGANFDIYFPTY